MSSSLGIHFGGAYTRLSGIENGKIVNITLPGNTRQIPTVIGYNRATQGYVIGEEADKLRFIDPANVIWNLPGLLYPAKNDAFADAFKKHGAVDISFDQNNAVSAALGNSKVTVESLVEIFLSEIRKSASEAMGQSFEYVIISVPASAGTQHKTALCRAAQKAGFRDCKLLSEGIASAAGVFHTEVQPDSDNELVVASVHMGYGSSNCSLISAGDGVFDFYDYHSYFTDKGAWYGDFVLAQKLRETVKQQENLDIAESGFGFSQLWSAAEKLREQSASNPKPAFNVNDLVTADGKVHNVSLAPGGNLIKSTYKESLEFIKGEIKNICGNEKLSQLMLTWESAYPAGLVNAEIGGMFSIYPSKGVAVRDAVSMGTGVRCAILDSVEGISDMLVIDVFSKNIGIEVAEQGFYPIIKAVTTVPTKIKETFTTSSDNQKAVSINVYEGLADNITGNNYIGTYDLEGIPPAPAGKAQVEITFDLDTNGVLTISAIETESGVKLSV